MKEWSFVNSTFVSVKSWRTKIHFSEVWLTKATLCRFISQSQLLLSERWQGDGLHSPPADPRSWLALTHVCLTFGASRRRHSEPPWSPRLSGRPIESGRENEEELEVFWGMETHQIHPNTRRNLGKTLKNSSFSEFFRLLLVSTKELKKTLINSTNVGIHVDWSQQEF